ncbi:MAG: GldG family protein [Oscillospiraceae bacterium]
MTPNKSKLSRSFKYNFVSVVITIILVAILVAVNIIFAKLSQRTHLYLDLTSEKVFEMSQQTKDYLQTVETKVDITVLMDDKAMENGGGYYLQAKNILDSFAYENSNISVAYIDPVVNPAFLSKYPQLDLTPYDILISTQEKDIKLSINDLFNISYDQYTQQPYIQSSKAEQALSLAIMKANITRSPRILLLTGNDQSYSEGLITLLQANGYDTSVENLQTSGVTDCDAVFLLAPERDLDPAQIKKLDNFLSNSGEFGKTLVFAPSPVAAPQPNLSEFMARWGVDLGDGIIMETSPSKILNNMPFYCIVDYSAQDFSSQLSTHAPVVSPMGKKLSVLFENKSSYSAKTLLNYSDTSFALPSNAAENWSPTPKNLQQSPALILSKYTKYSGMEAQFSSVLTFSSSTFFSADILNSTSVANAEYLLAALGESTHNVVPLSIAPKNLAKNELGLNQLQFFSVTALFVALLPLCVLICGVYVWAKRKNK